MNNSERLFVHVANVTPGGSLFRDTGHPVLLAFFAGVGVGVAAMMIALIH